jgi:hypothetical protein
MELANKAAALEYHFDLAESYRKRAYICATLFLL